MIRLISLICLFSLLSLQTFAQSANYRAQARYYSAKESYDAGKFEEASRMLLESREFLGGKSNAQLQHMLVLSLYHSGRYKEAQAEMARFFALHEGKEKQESFDEEVDKLTNNQVREITIVLDDIDDKVRRDVEGEKQRAAEAKRVAEQRRVWEAGLNAWRNVRRAEIAGGINAIVSRGYSAPYSTPNGRGTETGRASFAYVDGVGYQMRSGAEKSGRNFGGLYEQGYMVATWPTCAGVKVTINARQSFEPRIGLAYDEFWITVPDTIFDYELKREDITNGRRSVMSHDHRRTTSVSVEWIRLEGGQTTFDALSAIFGELSQLDSLSFEALDELRAAAK